GKTLKIGTKMDMFKNIAMTIERQMRPLAEGLGRTLTFDIPQGLPYLNTDGELLTRAFVKLVENALRYHKNEQGEVVIAASGEGNKLIVRIQDNGIGMTPDELRQLGTIYFRSEDEIVRSYKGSGLGVPIAFGIVEALGGRVSVTSEPDQGTTFTVTLTGMS
ncbi:MAG: HAMP domain-containing histidine kinase, partial [Anaerolineae bacterium]|nr:HAMP domain-containing histidine kinase [Anaerolineae bacterium]